MINKSSIFAKMIFLAVLFYLALLAFLFFFQRHLQYMPSGKIGQLSEYPLAGFSEQILTTSDSVKIFSWWKKPASTSQKIIVYFHGNAGNLGDRVNKLSLLGENGLGVLAISYRGYYGSLGSPTEAGLMLDGEAALKFLFDQGFKTKDIILFGESLGSGVAVQLAAKYNNFYAVVLESPYSSIVDVAKKRYWFAPVSLLLKDKFQSAKFAPKISIPVLIFHGTADFIVPYSEGKKLFDTIVAPKKLITVEGAGHLGFTNEFLLREIKKFLQENYKN